MGVCDDLISRQAAIDALLHNQEVYANHFGNDPIDKYTIALIDNDAQTIAQLPSAQPEKCEDCGNFNKTRLLIPQPERKTGQWIAVKIGNGDTRYTCSECGVSYECDSRDMWEFIFCPHCGAKM